MEKPSGSKPIPVTDPNLIEKLEKRAGAVPRDSVVAKNIISQLEQIKNAPNTWHLLDGIKSGSYVNRIIKRTLGESLVSKGGNWEVKRIKSIENGVKITRVYVRYVK